MQNIFTNEGNVTSLIFLLTRLPYSIGPSKIEKLLFVYLSHETRNILTCIFQENNDVWVMPNLT